MIWLAPAILGGAGIVLLIGGVERLVKTVRHRAVVAGVSALALGLLSTSVDLESTAASVASAARGLGTVAAGVSIGSVIFLVTAALGTACLLFPFSVKVPRYFLGVFVVAAVSASAVLAGGGITRLEGVGLLVLFAAMVAGSVRHLRTMPNQAVPESAGGRVATLSRTKLGFAATIAVCLAAMTVGAELVATAAEGALASTHLSQTLLGMVVVAVALSLEEGLIEVLPAYRGAPEIAVGNVLGTTAFLLTGSLGLAALIFPIRVQPQVATFHVPAMLGAVGLATWALTRPVTGRREGVVLLAYYALYLAGFWFIH
ncbi:MAG: calcium/sodium antiporter [Actinomycetota bacterium]